jgi:putative Mn2+ efflux pump MntP
MVLGFSFFFNSILLGVGLAMDAFSVSLANGLNEPHMPKRKFIFFAATFAFFQALMPMIGWVCVHTIAQYFQSFEKAIPWIALILLLFIGGNMLKEGISNKGEEHDPSSIEGVGIAALMVQGVATSIDALSVGFTIADYNLLAALLAALIIAAVTFVICAFGLHIGRKAGDRLGGRAEILGGCILIFIGIEIFVKSWL